MWACKDIDEYHLCNIAFSEEYSFCVSNPKHKIYDKDDWWCEHLRSLSNTPKIKNLCPDNKQRRKSYPAVIENKIQNSENFYECDEDDWWSEYWKSITNAPKIKNYASDAAPRRRNSEIVSKNRDKYSEKFSQSLNYKKTLIRKESSSGTQEFAITLRKRDGTFGFTIAVFIGGFFIKSLTRKHMFSHSRIRPGDRILQVNGKDISSFSHSKLISYLRNVPGSVNLKICRSCTVWRFCPKHSPPEVHTFNVVLEKPPNGDLNFSIRDSVEASDIQKYLLPSTAEVENVFPRSLAHCKGIKEGDRILEVNGESLLGKTAEEVIDTLQKINGVVKLVFCRL